MAETVLGPAPLTRSLEEPSRRPNPDLTVERSPSPRSDPSPNLTRRG